jgi:hypothetical protein
MLYGKETNSKKGKAMKNLLIVIGACGVMSGIVLATNYVMVEGFGLHPHMKVWMDKEATNAVSVGISKEEKKEVRQ